MNLAEGKKMNEVETEMAELLLMLLSEHKGTLNTDQQSYFFTEEKKYEWFDYTLMRDNLIDEGLVAWWGDEKYRVKLTQEGWKAAEIGLHKYRQQKERNGNSNRAMKQSEKLDLILKGLYEFKHDGKYYSLTWILQNNGVEVNFDEVFSLGKKLEGDGMVQFLGKHDDAMGSITTVGIEYVEEDSYSYSGHSITTNNYNISIQGHGNVFSMRNIQDNIIKNNATLNNEGLNDIAKAFEKLAEAVKDSVVISQEQQQEYLEHINFLSQEAMKPLEQRAAKPVIKTILNSCQEILTAVAHTTEIWHIWGSILASHFLK